MMIKTLKKNTNSERQKSLLIANCLQKQGAWAPTHTACELHYLVMLVNVPMETVMKNFDQTDAGMLPVLETDGTLRGYVSRSHLYSTYRKMVADMSAE